MVKSSSLQPWRLWSICWTLPIEIDQTISNQPHYPSGETIVLFSKVSWVSAVGLWPGPTGLYSLSLRCVSVPLSGSHQSLMSRNKAQKPIAHVVGKTLEWKEMKRASTWRYLKIFVGWDTPCTACVLIQDSKIRSAMKCNRPVDCFR